MANVKALHTSVGCNDILLTCTVGAVVGIVEEGLACNHCWPLHQKGISSVNFTVSPAKEGGERAAWHEGLGGCRHRRTESALQFKRCLFEFV